MCLDGWINPRARSELALLAVLAPLIATNLRATVQHQAWALDASSFAGATVRRKLTTAKLFWRHGERTGSYTRMEDRPRAVCAVNADVDLCYFEDDQSVGVSLERPLAQRLDFMEISDQGHGRVSQYLSASSFVTAPVFSHSRCAEYSLEWRRAIGPILWLLFERRLGFLFVQTPVQEDKCSKEQRMALVLVYVQPAWLALVPCSFSLPALVYPKCLSGAGSRSPVSVRRHCEVFDVRTLLAMRSRLPVPFPSRQVPRTDAR